MLEPTFENFAHLILITTFGIFAIWYWVTFGTGGPDDPSDRHWR